MVEDIHVKTREASQQNASLDMREFLGIDRTLQSIQGELLNNTSKLTKIDKHIKRDTKKMEEVENEPGHTDEQRRGDLNTKKQERLEILPQNWKDVQTQGARIRQTLKKFLIKMCPWQKEFVSFFVNKGLLYFQY